MAPNTNKYRPRIVDQQIESMLPMIGAIQIRGPKWCGKTTTVERHAKSVLRLHDPLYPKDYEEVARLNLGILLEGKTPRLIDERQTIPQIWNGVKNLPRLDDKVDAVERNKLSFLAVVTGDGYAYTDTVNGVKIHTIPIGCLKN